MLRQRAKLIASLVYIGNVMCIAASFFLAYWIRNTLLSTQYGKLSPVQNYLWLLLFILVVWSFLLYHFGLYRSYRVKSFRVELRDLVKTVLWGTLLIGVLIFTFKLHYVSRLFIFMFGVLAFCVLAAERGTIRALARQARRRGLNFRNILIVGSGRRARELAKIVEDHQEWSFRLLGIVVDHGNGDMTTIGRYPVIGNIEKMSEILHTHVVDEVIFAVSRKKLEGLEEIFLLCEELGIRARVAVNFFPHMIAKVSLDDLHGIPLLTFTTTPHNEFVLALKRGFDVIVASTSLLFLSPIFLLIALGIKMSSRGSVLFTQTRVGLNGRQFTLYKFRSMVQDAEQKKHQLLAMNQMDGPVFKMTNDPRVTTFGKFLRKTSLDEFPQLMNVLKGDMSIIGPRPPIPEEVAKYQSWQRRRLSMRPGLTCIWQVNGRNTIRDFDKWMKLDLQYIDNWSLGLDFKIFLKTIPTVFLGRGAN